MFTFPRLNGRLFCVHRISVSGIEPSTSQLMLYSISDAKCFGFDVMFIDVGFTVCQNKKRKKKLNFFLNIMRIGKREIEKCKKKNVQNKKKCQRHEIQFFPTKEIY